MLDLAPVVVSALLAIFIIGVLCVYNTLATVSKAREALPPGPKPLFLLGNILDFKSGNSHKMFKNWSEKYGSVITVWFGIRPAVVANDTLSIREVLVDKGLSFASRPETYLGYLHSPLRLGIVLSPYGPEWRFSRRLAHSALKAYGEHRSKLEGNLRMECRQLINKLKESSHGNIAINPKSPAALAVTNIISSILFGCRYEDSDPEFKLIFKSITSFSDAFGKLRLLNISKIFRLLKYKAVRELKDSVTVRNDFLQQKIDEHKKTFDPNNIRDFTDLLLEKSVDSSLHGDDPKPSTTLLSQQVLMILADLLFAGFDTTHNTILWAILYLSTWPDTQERAYVEIKEYFLKNKTLTYMERSSLPYLQAVIHEVLRLSSIAPLSVGHETNKETTLCGYHLPKGTLVFTNLYALQHDPRIWNNPEEFNPERFLGKDGTFSLPNENLLPFGAGPRSCAGESLGKTELFFVVGYLVRHFQISIPNEDNPPSLNGIQRAILEPEPFKVLFTPRT